MYPHHQQNMYYPNHAPSYDIPMTPLDMAYSQSMIPSNLLAGSPYFMNSFAMSPIQQEPPMNYLRQYVPPSSQQHHHHHHPHAPYGNGYAVSSQDSTLDQLCLSRTVVLKNLSEDVTLTEVLDAIDFGPIEYCKIFKKQALPNLEDVKNVQNCYISFLNSKISVNFHNKYAKNKQNMAKLRSALKNSKHLKLVLNDSTNRPNGHHMANKQDFIKLKTLNYILDFSATRCLRIKFTETKKFEEIESDLKEQCGRFGEVEKFELKEENDSRDQSPESSKKDDDKTQESESLEKPYIAWVHFTSIDSAIKGYDYYSKRIQRLQQRQVDEKKTSVSTTQADGKPATGSSATVRTFNPIGISFHKDRCDKSHVDNIVHRSNNASPVISRRSTTNASGPHNHFLPNESIISIPEDDSFGSDNSETFSEFNSQIIMEDNEGSILDSSSKNGDHLDQDSSTSSFNGLDRSSSIVSLNQGAYYPPQQHNQHQSYPPIQPHISSQSVYSGGYFGGGGGGSTHSLPPLHSGMQQKGYPSYNSDAFNVGNRTIYLGNLHPHTTIEEIANNVRAGGLVQLIKHHPEKKVCFITFIDPSIALKFFLNHQVLHQLVIHGYDVTVGWAKNHSGPLNRDISLAVTAGASRNVYIGIAPNKVEPDAPKPVIPDEKTLRSDFSKFGELEQINFYHNKDCGFLNFLNIADAIKLVDCFVMKNEEKIRRIVGDSGEFYEKYKCFKINFAKDRCGNPAKFSFRKRSKAGKHSNYRDVDLYEVDIVNELRETSRLEEELRNNSPPQEPLNEEAAKVFGIIECSKKEEDTNNILDDVNDDILETSSDIVDANSQKRSTTHEKGELEKNVNEGTEKLEEEHEVEEEDDEDEEDDDEVSIIIGSDTGSSSMVCETKPDSNESKNKNGARKSLSRSTSSEAFFPKRDYSRNSSNISLNTHFGKNGYQHSQAKTHSPYSQPQSMYYRPSSAPMRLNNGPHYGYHQQQQHQQTFPPQHVSTPYGQIPHYSSQPHLLKNPYGTSGSQVMAQYLAQSQHENLLYAAAIFNGGMDPEEDIEYNYRGKRTYRRKH
ncbi:hypothetical protein CAAN1_29S00848 [[Candida] anglica]|uniref:RRM domain-containing protein n=1 Tax=[Candida] anglica TaxID=148631 RepID=A0ABP0EBY8_9ASCO